MATEEIARDCIWIPLRTLKDGGGALYFSQSWDDTDVKYVRVDRAPNTRQRVERAASLIWTYMIFNGQGRSRAEVQAQIADIIAAEFEK